MTLCDPMNCSPPGLPVHHKLPEFTQTHAHRVGDTIQPSQPLSSPSPAVSLSQHQDLFKWVSSLHQVAKVLEIQLQHQSFQWTSRTYLLQDGLAYVSEYTYNNIYYMIFIFQCHSWFSLHVSLTLKWSPSHSSGLSFLPSCLLSPSTLQKSSPNPWHPDRLSHPIPLLPKWGIFC